MSVLNELASALNRRDEEPNQQLAMRLVESENLEDIQELVDNLKNKNKAIRSNCIKVLYEVGEKKPELIENYVDEFVALLTQKDNRMVWGGMTALGCMASRKPHEIWGHTETIFEATQNGSAITQDWGIRVLATVSAERDNYSERVFPFLMEFLKACRPKDVPRHAESMIIAANTHFYREQMRHVLEGHRPDLKSSQLKRVEKIIRQLED